jgi:superfamily II DNA or RNA helicase
MKKPRDYQGRSFGVVVDRATQGHRKTLIDLATGMGKTYIMCMLAAAAKKPLLITNSLPIMKQVLNALSIHLEEDVDLEQAENFISNSPIFRRKAQVASKDSLLRGRYKRDAFKDRTIVLVDEVHHGCSSPRFIEMMEYFESIGAFIVGFSATPYKGNGLPLPYWGRPDFSYSFREAVRDGWLVPEECVVSEAISHDLSMVKTVQGDFHSGQLEAILCEEQAVQEASSLVLQTYSQQPSVIYCSGKRQALLLFEVFERYGITVSIVHDGQTQAERFMNMQMFESGESKIIISIDVLGFGWDFPELRNIYNLAPTKSVTRILQRLGRGARTRDSVLKEGMTREERLSAIAADEKSHFKWYDGTETISGFQMKSTNEIIDEAEERERNKKRRKNSRKNKGEGGDENYELSEYDPDERRERRQGIVVGHDFQHADRDVDTEPTKKKRGWRMLWGPFKGKLIAELPTNYLENVLRNRKVPKTEEGKRKHREPPIYTGIRRELQHREAV